MSAGARVGLEQVNLVVSMFVEELAQQRGKYCKNSEHVAEGVTHVAPRPETPEPTTAIFILCLRRMQSKGRLRRKRCSALDPSLTARWHRGGPEVLVTPPTLPPDPDPDASRSDATPSFAQLGYELVCIPQTSRARTACRLSSFSPKLLVLEPDHEQMW